MTNLKLNQTRRTKIKKTQQPTVHNGLLRTPSFYFWFTSYIWRVVYILLLVYVLPERRNSSSRFWLLSCMPLSPAPPPSSIWFRLICPELSGTKEVVGFFFLMAKQKVIYFFPGRFRLIHIMRECIHAFGLSSAHRLLQQPRLRVSQMNSSSCAMYYPASNSQRHPGGNHPTCAWGHIHVAGSPSWSRTPGLTVLL